MIKKHMYHVVMVVLLLFFSLGCSADFTSDSVTDEYQEVPVTDAQVTRGGTQTLGEYTDPSGRVNVKIYYKELSSYRKYFPGGGCEYAYGSIQVEPDRVLIGGSAWTDWDNNGAAGSFITKSYPSSSLTHWYAESKDHGAYSPHKLYIYAVGLKIKGNNGQWISKNTLMNYVRFAYATSSRAQHPTVSVQPPAQYETVGGGVRTNWSKSGQLVLESYRDYRNNSWVVKSKDHMVAEVTDITAYAIALYKGNIPDFGYFDFTHVANNSGDISGGDNGKGEMTAIGYDNWVPAGAGVKSISYNNMGRLVTGFKYEYSEYHKAICITARSKDHGSVASGTLTAYLTLIRKK